jgi:hypothetical protein
MTLAEMCTLLVAMCAFAALMIKVVEVARKN